VVKSYNDKIAIMNGSVHSYQIMVDKQSSQLKAVSQEKDRLKRDLSERGSTVDSLKQSLKKKNDDCSGNISRLEDNLGQVQRKYNNLATANTKLENKYTTLSKSNAVSISEIERLTGENKLFRDKLDDERSSKASQIIRLKDNLGAANQERDKYKDQYSALFKQYQQSIDNVQILQEERDRLKMERNQLQQDLDKLHKQINKIQKLTGASTQGKKNEDIVMKVEEEEEEEGEGLEEEEVEEVDHGQLGQTGIASSSALPVMEEPVGAADVDNFGASPPSSSSPAPKHELQGAGPSSYNNNLAVAAPLGALRLPNQAASPSPSRSSSRPPIYPVGGGGVKMMPLAPAPPLQAASQPTVMKQHPAQLRQAQQMQIPQVQVGQHKLQPNFISPYINEVDSVQQQHPVYRHAQAQNYDEPYHQLARQHVLKPYHEQGDDVDSLQAPRHHPVIHPALANQRQQQHQQLQQPYFFNRRSDNIDSDQYLSGHDNPLGAIGYHDSAGGAGAGGGITGNRRRNLVDQYGAAWRQQQQQPVVEQHNVNSLHIRDF